MAWSMRDSSLMKELYTSTTSSLAYAPLLVTVPVTVKMRLGWDEKHMNVVECAGAAQAGGAAAVAIHGRTREQYYSGKARWDLIREVKQSLSIPVIGNGDIFTAEDALRMLDETGCDMVMIARGALGNPWIFREMVHLYQTGETLPPPQMAEVRDMMLRQLSMMAQLKGEKLAVLEMRKHVGWYIKGVPGAAQIRGQVNRISDLSELRDFLTGIPC